MYPTLNLSQDEYVIVSIRRHLIGLIAPFGIGIFLIALAFSALFNFDLVAKAFQLSGTAAQPINAVLPTLLFVLFVALGTYAAYYIYINNKFFLTNESVIEVTQLSLFSHREQSISLANIEDASYTKNGMLQGMFDYGSIRLSTVGDMTAYKFSYVAQPKQSIDMINTALETYKASRPIKTE